MNQLSLLRGEGALTYQPLTAKVTRSRSAFGALRVTKV
jgi:hypothetical protein